jgi:hypothetical protein
MADETGLEDRYEVRRRTDPVGKHAGCRYFVLDPQHDRAARLALWHYAEAVEPTNLVLAREICAWLNDLEEP